MANALANRLATPPLQEALEGLLATPKTLPSKLLYDAEGSRLFERICKLPEYYVTRVELALLQRTVAEVASRIPARAALVEFGSGASVKTRLLLDARPDLAVYVPIDISHSALSEASAALQHDYPALAVTPLVGDFTRPLTLPPLAREAPAFGFFPGSTLGNFEPAEAIVFLRNARQILGPNPHLLVGADLAKPLEVLLPAYDDAEGVTADFNRNLLVRLNREAGADFDPDAFAHRAVWNAERSRIEMHLVSRTAQRVRVAGEEIAFAAGETIHTENSHKYFPEVIASLAEAAGWRVAKTWLSDAPVFGLFLLEA